MSDLYTKVNQSVKLLKTVAKTIDGPIELCYSGGKDSDVILRLAQMAGINYRAIYKNTTIDPPGTIKHFRYNGVEIIQPKRTFFQIIEKSGFPNRFHRFCCSELKEYKIMNSAIQGIRRSESSKRATRYNEPVICRMYNKKDHVNTIFPILEWSDHDVKLFINSEGIKCHSLYYIDGVFNVNKRLGCLGCPLSSKAKRIEVFKQYPRMVKAWIRHGAVWFERCKERGNITASRFSDVYQLFLFTLLYDRIDDMNINRNLFGKESAKELLENYFKIDL